MRDGRLDWAWVVLLALAGCGGGGSSGTPSADPTTSSTSRPTAAPAAGDGTGAALVPPEETVTGAAAPNAAPVLSGAPPTSATADQDYVFQPLATDPEGDALRFTAVQLPAWLALDPETGRISGRPRPTDQGIFGPILLTASDGKNTVSLPEFTVTVAPPGQGTAPGSAKRGITLSWSAPERNDDGSPISIPPKYRIHYGRESGEYDRQVDVGAGVTRYTLTDLEPGVWFLALTSVGEDGVESDYSEEIKAVVA